ncbi:MAG: hypothetical protein KKE20_02725, partial [Nanoarchaeota archaeon]|nr:hypothetical protein [Nanoarchaeota archaeon]
MRKKAQLEMIGIAIVVVLVVLGFLFVLKAISKPPSTVHTGFVRSHITQDLLNTVSIADADCGGIDMTDLLKACAEGGTVDCAADPCDAFRVKIGIVLEQTLEVQKLAYRLRTYRTDEPPKTSADALNMNGRMGGIYFEYDGCNETSMNRGYYIVKEKPGMLV